MGYWEDRDTVFDSKVTFSNFDIINLTLDELTPILESLKSLVSDTYANFGSNQLEIWLTAETVSIFLSQ